MIIIQSQDKKLWDGLHIGYSDKEPVIYSQGYAVASYNTAEQRDYVMEQIALAIERGDRLYRMPSVEEVEKVLTPEMLTVAEYTCLTCKYRVVTFEELEVLGHDPCETCDSNLRNWKPKEL